jgi:hypothetical protein
MASTRNRNTRGNYNLEEKQYKNFENYTLYPNSQYGEAYDTKLAGNGLNPGQIKHSWEKKDFKDDEFKNYVSSTLKRQLENNHATIITIIIVNRAVENSKGVGHYIIVYKYNNILYYFDPQDNTTTTDPNNILKNKQYYIRSYGSFETYKVLKSTDLVNNNCQLEYVIGGW